MGEPAGIGSAAAAATGEDTQQQAGLRNAESQPKAERREITNLFPRRSPLQEERF